MNTTPQTDEIVQVKAKDLKSLLDKVDGLLQQNASLTERVNAVEKKDTRIVVFLGDVSKRKGFGDKRFVMDDDLGLPTIELPKDTAIRIVESEIKDKTFNFCMPDKIKETQNARNKRIAERQGKEEADEKRYAANRLSRQRKIIAHPEPTVEDGYDYLENANKK